MKNSFYEKPLLEEEKDNVGEYLFPFDLKETKEIKEVIEKLPKEIIDFHNHSGPVEAIIKNERILTSYGEIFLYRELMATLIHRAILSGAITRQKLHKVYQVVMAFPFQGIDMKKANKWLLKETGEGSGFLPFLMPLPGEEGLEETRKALGTGYYFGIAEITPQLTEPRAKHLRGEEGYLSEEFLEVVNNQELPMTLHLPTHLLNHVEEIKKLSEDYPKLKIVLAHMGLVLVLTPRSKAALTEVATLPNVYFDTSTVTDKEVFAHVLKESGSKKILFASDAPYDALKLEVRFTEGKMRIFSPQNLPGTEKVEEEIQKMLISGPKALLDAIEEVYPDKEQAKLVKENIFHQNALEILPRELPPFREEWMWKKNGVMTKYKI